MTPGADAASRPRTTTASRRRRMCRHRRVHDRDAAIAVRPDEPVPDSYEPHPRAVDPAEVARRTECNQVPIVVGAVVLLEPDVMRVHPDRDLPAARVLTAVAVVHDHLARSVLFRELHVLREPLRRLDELR